MSLYLKFKVLGLLKITYYYGCHQLNPHVKNKYLYHLLFEFTGIK